jgi:hypothetical protein
MHTTVVFALKFLAYFTLISMLELGVLKAIKHTQTNTRARNFQHRKLTQKYEKKIVCIKLLCYFEHPSI